MSAQPLTCPLTLDTLLAQSSLLCTMCFCGAMSHRVPGLPHLSSLSTARLAGTVLGPSSGSWGRVGGEEKPSPQEPSVPDAAARKSH